MTGPDVGERGPAVEVLATGGDVEQGQLVEHRVGHAHVDAAERVDDPLEAEEVDVQDVVDLHPGELLHRPGDALSATPSIPPSNAVLILPSPTPGMSSTHRSRGNETNTTSRRSGVHEDDRVRAVLAADVGVVAERDDLLLGEPLARVAAEQQVARALVAPAGDVHGSRDT